MKLLRPIHNHVPKRILKLHFEKNFSSPAAFLLSAEMLLAVPKTKRTERQ
jgi:hypothetical protein